MDKPKIVFLHGSGTNANIFRLQSRKLAALLTPHYTLLYLDGPHPCAPGPGVLPFFEGCGPYRTWMHDSSPAAEQAYYDGGEMAKLVEEVRGFGGVVGVVGFSMGGKVGMEVVRRLEGVGGGGDGGGVGGGVDGGRGGGGDGDKGVGGVKVVVAVCGTVPFQGGGRQGGLDDKGKEEEQAREKGYRESLARGVVKAESVHLIGEGDPWRGESEKLVGFFREEKRRVIRFRGGHHMPVEDAANRQVASIIMMV